MGIRATRLQLGRPNAEQFRYAAPCTRRPRSVSDVSPGPGWWLASDGKWYAPELHPDAGQAVGTDTLLGDFGIPRGEPLPVYYSDPSPILVFPAPQVPVQGAAVQPPRRARPGAILIGLVVALVALAIGAPIAGHVVGSLSGHGPPVPAADDIPVPSSPPQSLVGQTESPRGLQENSAWLGVVTKVRAVSTVSFGAVYGTYPPPVIPTTQTFLAIAAKPTGGIADIAGAMNREFNGLRSVAQNNPGSTVSSLPLHASESGGQIECVSVTFPKGAAGECIWMNPTTFIQVGTFTSDLAVVRSMTEQIISELRTSS